VLPLLPALAFAADPVHVASADFRGYVDQARFFIKRGWYDDAEEQLVLATATEDGELDPEAWFLLAKVRYERADVHGARFAADRALVNSRDDDTTRQTRELLDFFEEKFGMVMVSGPQEATATLLDVQLESTLFDPELRVFFTTLQARVAEEPVVLPHPLGLPAGRYTINGEAVDVAAGGRAPLPIPLQGTKSTVLQTLQLELAAGAGFWFGPDASHLLPAPTAQLSLSAPVGSWVLGASLDWVPTLTQVQSGGFAFAATGLGVGARAGFELPNTQPIVVRPSIGYRAFALPSLETACTVAGEQATCGDGDPQLYIYGQGFAHGPQAEFALYYQNRRKRSSWGAGIKTIGELAFASLPATSTAQTLDDRSYEVSVAEGTRGRVLPGIRLLGELSFAF